MTHRTWKESAMALPGIGVSLLPKVVCPICSAAYAALVSSLGLGFLISTRYLLSLTAVFLAIAVGALGFRASSRRGFGPFWIGLVAAACVTIGKFWLDSTVTTYTGVSLLVIASIWNAVPCRNTSDFCPDCLPTEAAAQQRR
jgi:hypothetical protein